MNYVQPAEAAASDAARRGAAVTDECVSDTLAAVDRPVGRIMSRYWTRSRRSATAVIAAQPRDICPSAAGVVVASTGPATVGAAIVGSR